MAQSGLACLLFRQHNAALQAYADLHVRLAHVDQALNDLTWGPAVLDPRPVPEGTPEDGLVFRTVTLKNGITFEVALDPRWMDPITDAIAAGDTWFLDDYYVLLDILRPGDTVLDLGGHVGTFALAAAALGCHVACVEAAPRHIRLLEASAARNGFDSLYVIHGAVADHEGRIEFFPSGPWGTIANRVVMDSPGMIQARTLDPISVPALTVDGLLSRLGWDDVSAVKLDVEGAEIAALRGMEGLLSRDDAPVVLYEANTQTLEFFDNAAGDLRAALERHGYTSYNVEPGRLIPSRPDELEPQSCINCLAVKGPPDIPGWRVTGPRSREQTIQKVIGESLSARAFDRAYVARVLAQADPGIRSDRRIRGVLGRLSRDADESVRLAASWSLTGDRSAAPVADC
jgi:FkbM family methyltransferase